MAGKHVGTDLYTDALTHRPAFPGSRRNLAWSEGATGNPAANPHTAGTPEYLAYEAGAAASSQHEAGAGVSTPEADLAITRISAQGTLSAGEETAIRAFVNGIVADGDYALLDDCWICKVGDSEAVEANRLNMSITGIKSLSATAAGSTGPGHTVNAGINMASTLATVNHLTVPAPDTLTNYSLNSASIGAYYLNVSAIPQPTNFGVIDGTASLQAAVRTADGIRSQTNCGTPDDLTPAEAQASGVLYMIGRYDASNHYARKGTTVATAARASQGVPSFPVVFHGRNNSGTPDSSSSTCDIALYFIGANLTSNGANFEARVNTLMAAL